MRTGAPEASFESLESALAEAGRAPDIGKAAQLSIASSIAAICIAAGPQQVAATVNTLLKEVCSLLRSLPTPAYYSPFLHELVLPRTWWLLMFLLRASTMVVSCYCSNLVSEHAGVVNGQSLPTPRNICWMLLGSVSEDKSLQSLCHCLLNLSNCGVIAEHKERERDAVAIVPVDVGGDWASHGLIGKARCAA
jgi:hypothetical protein